VIGLPDKQLLDDFARIDFGGVGQVEVDHRRLQTRMAEEFLDRLERDSGFQKTRRVGMAQRVGRNLFAKVEHAHFSL